MDKRHEIISDIKRVRADLGRTPLRAEYTFEGLGNYSEWDIKRQFKNWSGALAAAGLEPDQTARFKAGTQAGKRSKFKYKNTKIESITIHEIGLGKIFKQAGNPESIKMVAMPDTHCKHKDNPAVDCFLDFVKSYDPHIFMIMGDFLDCEGLSHWPPKSSEPRRIVPEAIQGRAATRSKHYSASIKAAVVSKTIVARVANEENLNFVSVILRRRDLNGVQKLAVLNSIYA